MKRAPISMIVLVLTLAACAAKEPPPAIAYDGAAFHPATIAPEPPRPVEVVEIPTPLPLPGQLQPLPEPVKPDQRKPTLRVAAANRAALQEPSAHGYINAIQVIPTAKGRSIASMPRPNRSATSGWSRANSSPRCRPATPPAGRGRGGGSMSWSSRLRRGSGPI
ncbi:exported hypothetical protein [Magnetospirillum molischianum DSM 120]|uniref:Uncharacterized protein n=1 Tax=Magnetospirillum molischianum DSM 120 TaxID=1150626 RepID=H8FWI9_MAGML|nr:exported hypothetical protein [Magnetospirillum molischianum DSM 120]